MALIADVTAERAANSHAALEYRILSLRPAAAILIGKVFAECGAFATLLKRRFPDSNE
jgi:hypothetical protein